MCGWDWAHWVFPQALSCCYVTAKHQGEGTWTRLCPQSNFTDLDYVQKEM